MQLQMQNNEPGGEKYYTEYSTGTYSTGTYSTPCKTAPGKVDLTNCQRVTVYRGYLQYILSVLWALKVVPD